MIFKYEIVQYNDLYLLRRSLFGKFFRCYLYDSYYEYEWLEFIEDPNFYHTKQKVEQLYCILVGIEKLKAKEKEKLFKVIG